MMNKNRINFSNCPACGSDAITKVLAAKDYTVSHAFFDIWHCDACSFRFTQDIPDAHHIGPYYQSVNYISHSETTQGFVSRCYHLIRKHTLRTKRNLIKSVSRKYIGALLDVGAGTGAFLKTMQDAGWEVMGLEPDETARKNASNKYQVSLRSPEQLYDLAPGSFDVITMWHVLEHVHDLHGYLDKYAEILKPKGKLVIAVPNYTSYDAQYYQQFWAAYDVPRHLYHFSPQSMKILAASKGFKVKTVYPMWFDSYYVSMLSEQYKRGKNNYFMAMIIGLISNINTLFNKERCSSVIYILSK